MKPKWGWLGVFVAVSLAFAAGFYWRAEWPWSGSDSEVARFLKAAQAAQNGQAGSASMLPPSLLQAASASGADNFAIATGPVDDDVEGLFVLDFMTGELQCVVLNYRTGRFGGLFRANVMQDLGSDAAKKPKFVMVAGQINFPRGAAAARPGNSVVYVLDTASGAFGAYGLPWRRELAATGRGQMAPMILLDVGRARTAALRE